MDASTALQTLSIILQVAIILTCLAASGRRAGSPSVSSRRDRPAGPRLRLRPGAGEAPVDVILTASWPSSRVRRHPQSGGLDVMMQKVTERVYVDIPSRSPSWVPAYLVPHRPVPGTASSTMLPIVADIAIKKNIRPERPMASSVAAQMGITAHRSHWPVSIVSIIAKNTDRHWSVLRSWRSSRRHCAG